MSVLVLRCLYYYNLAWLRLTADSSQTCDHRITPFRLRPFRLLFVAKEGPSTGSKTTKFHIVSPIFITPSSPQCLPEYPSDPTIVLIIIVIHLVIKQLLLVDNIIIRNRPDNRNGELRPHSRNKSSIIGRIPRHRKETNITSNNDEIDIMPL